MKKDYKREGGMQDCNKDKRVRAFARLGSGCRVAVATCTRTRMRLIASGWRGHEPTARLVQRNGRADISQRWQWESVLAVQMRNKNTAAAWRRRLLLQQRKGR